MPTCPVCGFPDGYFAYDDVICSCCGTHLGYEDLSRTHAELRAAWIAGGCRWWSPSEEPPPGWNAAKQLEAVRHARHSG
jgi:hypothetical protein